MIDENIVPTMPTDGADSEARHHPPCWVDEIAMVRAGPAARL